MIMNERILELAKKAGLKKEHCSDREYIGDFEWREFGELLIRECVKIIDDTPLGYGDYRDQILKSMRDHCVERVKYHFGVDQN